MVLEMSTVCQLPQLCSAIGMQLMSLNLLQWAVRKLHSFFYCASFSVHIASGSHMNGQISLHPDLLLLVPVEKPMYICNDFIVEISSVQQCLNMNLSVI